LESFLAHAREHYDGGLPRYVEAEQRAYLDCSVFAPGFTPRLTSSSSSTATCRSSLGPGDSLSSWVRNGGSLDPSVAVRQRHKALRPRPRREAPELGPDEPRDGRNAEVRVADARVSAKARGRRWHGSAGSRDAWAAGVPQGSARSPQRDDAHSRDQARDSVFAAQRSGGTEPRREVQEVRARYRDTAERGGSGEGAKEGGTVAGVSAGVSTAPLRAVD
jgi:hypothetical protein